MKEVNLPSINPNSAQIQSISPADLSHALEVLKRAGDLDPYDPVSLQLQRGASKLFKHAKKNRRRQAKLKRKLADNEVLSATITAHPDRVDDDTIEVPQPNPPTTTWVGTLNNARQCYVCKTEFWQVHWFYHHLCPTCAEHNFTCRNARVDLSGRRALVTGGRAKIGMQIALKLLRDGADVTITTRFPKDAVRRFSALPDASQWQHRLHVIGIDLRDLTQVVKLGEQVSALPLDILINNAAQTIKRRPSAYALLQEGEQLSLSAAESTIDMKSLNEGFCYSPSSSPAHQISAQKLLDSQQDSTINETATQALKAVSALTPFTTNRTVDAGGLIPDEVAHNSWVAKIGEIDPVEMLEVQLCNAVAPFILINILRPALAAAKTRRRYIVNVSAMEGVFYRNYKSASHPHTNMAKAALNMLTRTSAEDLYQQGILMTAVDTGWITDERPHTTKVRLAEAGFRTPLDLIDGAARVYNPIVQGENGVDLYGCFLKNFVPHPW